MRAVIVYESMFGSTRAIAQAIAEGLADCAEVSLVPVGSADSRTLEGADLLVVGAPTHIHGLPRPKTRRLASEQATKRDSGVVLEPGAGEGPGVREWLGTLGPLHLAGVAAFDTRLNLPAVFSGRASRAIARSLHHHGVRGAARPESFLVDKTGKLVPGEVARARAWGEQLTWSSCLARVVEHQREHKTTA